MSNWWYATSVDVEQGSNLVRVNTGDDTRYFERGSCWLKVVGHDAVETDGLITDGSDTFIRLVKDWSGDTDTGRRAFAFRTVPDFQGVADKLALNIQASERVVSDVIGKIGTLLTSTDESVVIETPEGDETVVPYGYLKNQIESEWGDIKQDVSVTQARLSAMEKLKRDAVVYLDFASNEGKEADDFTINRATATDLITYTAADGVSVNTADGRIVFAPADTPALGWNNGQAVGLVTAPASTNLVSDSEGATISLTTAGSTYTFGDITLTEFIESTATGNKNYVVTSAPPAGIYTYSFYFLRRQIGSERWLLGYSGNSGATINTTTLDTSTAGDASIRLEHVGGDLYRACITLTTTGDIIITRMRNNTSITTGSYTGDGESGVVVGAPQLEQGYPTPYIKTEGSQVTRGQVLSRVDRLIGHENLTIYWEGYYRDLGNVDRRAFALTNGSNNNRLAFFKTLGGVFQFLYSDGSITSTTAPANAFNADAINKVVVTKSGDEFKLFINGVSHGTSSVPKNFVDFTQLDIGNQLTSTTTNYNDPILGISVLQYALTDAEALALTTLED